MEKGETTASVQRRLDVLLNVRAESAAGPLINELLGRSVERLHLICGRMLHQQYPRLLKGPVNFRSEELLSAVIERMIKAMRTVRPANVRLFFGLANQHIRWELNDMARRLDERARILELPDSIAARVEGEASDCPGNSGFKLGRILKALENLPADELEAFQLVRIQGMSNVEAAEVIGVATRTVYRRLNRALVHLAEALQDLGPSSLDRDELNPDERDQ